jgi:hypothetical protein
MKRYASREDILVEDDDDDSSKHVKKVRKTCSLLMRFGSSMETELVEAIKSRPE